MPLQTLSKPNITSSLEVPTGCREKYWHMELLLPSCFTIFIFFNAIKAVTINHRWLKSWVCSAFLKITVIYLGIFRGCLEANRPFSDVCAATSRQAFTHTATLWKEDLALVNVKKEKKREKSAGNSCLELSWYLLCFLMH